MGLRHYERLLSEVEGFPAEQAHEYASQLCGRNFNVACETGICYPTLPAMLNSDALLMLFSVRYILLARRPVQALPVFWLWRLRQPLMCARAGRRLAPAPAHVADAEQSCCINAPFVASLYLQSAQLL